jgi:hypothetical protein
MNILLNVFTLRYMDHATARSVEFGCHSKKLKDTQSNLGEFWIRKVRPNFVICSIELNHIVPAPVTYIDRETTIDGIAEIDVKTRTQKANSAFIPLNYIWKAN